MHGNGNLGKHARRIYMKGNYDTSLKYGVDFDSKVDIFNAKMNIQALILN